MGGRGATSTAAGSSFAKSLKSAGSSKEIATLLRDRYGIDVDASFDTLDKERASYIAEGISAVYEEFGSIPELRKLYAEKLPGGILGQTRTAIIGGELKSTIFMATSSKDYGNDSMDGVKGTIAHELGHVIAVHITNREYPNAYERAKAYNKNLVATSIMGEAVRNVKKTEYGKGKSAQELRRGISLYAGHYKGGNGNSEAMAEAVDDYVINGAKANPLSLETVKIIKRRLTG